MRTRTRTGQFVKRLGPEVTKEATEEEKRTAIELNSIRPGKLEWRAPEPIPKVNKPIVVNVRWWDGYLEVFECSQVRQGGHIVWMRLTNGQNRTIPLTGNVRWFSTDPESHASSNAM